LYLTFGRERGDEFGRAGVGVDGLGQAGIQSKDVRQGVFQLSDDAVKDGAFGAFGGDQADIGIGKADGAATDLGQRADGFLHGFRPPRAWHAKTHRAACRPRCASRNGRLEDPGAGLFGIRATGVKAGAVFLDLEAQGEGRDHRARRGDLQCHHQPGRGRTFQLVFQPCLGFCAVGNGRDRHTPRFGRDFGTGQFLHRGNGETKGVFPSVGGRVIR